MKIDLHIHSRDGSDGRWPLKDIFAEAARRGIELIAITDHDSIEGLEKACELAGQYGLRWLSGVELNVTFTHPDYKGGRGISLDFLGYDFDRHDAALRDKLALIRRHRQERARQILDKINSEFAREGRPGLTPDDLHAIEASVDGAFGRPHIASYLIKKGIVANKQEAFDRYLVRCDVPKWPLSLEEAASLIHGAGGKLFLAHPNDPHGTSLVAVCDSIKQQQRLIREGMQAFIDGVECWHSRADAHTAASYAAFCQAQGLLVSGGSDCHQQPLLMGEVAVPARVAAQFGIVEDAGSG